MAESVQRLPGAERLTPLIFGVRHLSPAGAYHLMRLLDEKRPRCVLVEGPADCTPLIGELTKPKVCPPVAILAYTAAEPVASICFPMASYSPEYQAILWAKEHGAACRFIDLPTGFSLPARDGEWENGDAEEALSRRAHFRQYEERLYERLVRLDGWDDFESYWEANFEHNSNKDAYLRGVREYSAQIRRITEEFEKENHPAAYRYNALREAYMKREIAHALSEGYRPEEIVVVCGAYHVTGLGSAGPPLTDAELAALPRRETRTTLMPYSYYKLSSRSGYGAGNHAPYYFERLFMCWLRGAEEKLPAIYLSALAGILRERGASGSTASVIEAVRLAYAMASLKDSPSPILADLHAAAVACLGHGELSEIAQALALSDVGTAIGSLPEGISRTPVQDDFNRQLARLRLEKYKSAVAQDLELDLRENRRVQSEEAAFLDLNRSTLLHRLRFLAIPFAQYVRANRQSATWYEKWALRWTPEAEIALVEANLKGETIEVAAAYVLKERLDECTDVLSAAELIRTACECRLPESLRDALRALHELAVDSGSFADTAGAAHELSHLIQYGDVRRYDPAPVVPLLIRLFLRACLLMQDSAACDDQAANDILHAMNLMHVMSQEHFNDVDDALWLRELKALAFRDDRNAKLSGAAFAILLERGEVPEEKYAAEVSRRLSPGIPADLGAGWFEGLAGRNRYALLSRVSLWRELDGYIAGLSEEEFPRCLVFLRRAFSAFDAQEKNSAAELLASLWGMDGWQVAELLQGELNEAEQASLDALNEFDFGDF